MRAPSGASMPSGASTQTPGGSPEFISRRRLRYAERGSMRALFLIPMLCLLVAPRLPAQAESGETPGSVDAITVLDATVEIPRADLRRVSLPRMKRGAEVLVEFSSGRPAIAMVLEILQREETGEGRPIYRNLRQLPIAASGQLQYTVPADGNYVLALRQAEASGAPARIQLHVQVRHPRVSVAPRVVTLSREKRIAVAMFSLGFLWTTLLLCGAPIIRAFRSRRMPPSPPWFG